MSDPIKITINHELLKNVNITESNKQIHDIQASVRDITEQAKKLYSIDFVSPMQESIARLREASIKPLLFPTDIILNSTQELSRQIRALVFDYAIISRKFLEQVSCLSTLDFRIGVLGQQFESKVKEKNESALNSLVELPTEASSEPNDDLPKEILSVLNEYKEIVREQKDILHEFYEARNEEIDKKNLKNNQKENLFLLNREWYLETLCAAVLSYVLEKILNQLDPAYLFIVLKYLIHLIH